MTEHNLFYYPYASFTNVQLPLLKVAALYFDKLYVLDPFKAVSGGEEFARGSKTREEIARQVKLLETEKLLEAIHPAEVLGKYDGQIAAAIRKDLQDPDYLKLCGSSERPRKWMLALAKVPKRLLANGEFESLDRSMQTLMGTLPNDLIPLLESYYQEVTGQKRYEEMTPEAYTEHSVLEDQGERVDYRYREFSLPLGESIMLNHALFGGLLHAGATPITDDPFHNEALCLKLRRAAQDPVIQHAVTNRARARQLKADLLAAATLTDVQLELPVLSPELHLEEVLECRRKHGAELRQARDKLGWMARRIEAEPWSEAFAAELEHKTIPDVAKELDEVRKARDAWLNSKRGRLALSAAGIAVGTAAVVLSILTAPVTPIALATAGLSLASGTAIPGVEWLLDWRDGKKSVQENGLHYLLRL